jgi:hypothetical protein
MKDAEHIRKHGHGTPWKHRYRVKSVGHHHVVLDVPTDGSVPRIMEKQLIRRCELAPAETHAPTPGEADLTEFGIPLPEATFEPDATPADVDDPDQVYDIERVLRAYKTGGQWMLEVKWKGYDEPSPVARKHVLDETNNEELIKEIADACERYSAERRALRDYDDDEQQPVQPAGDAEPVSYGRGLRRRPVVRYQGLGGLVMDAFDSWLTEVTTA